MNERIQQLAEQAGYTKDMFGVGHWDMPECKKFAELIIQECISTIENAENGYRDYRNQIENGMRNHCISLIKNKFGVEE